MFYLSCFFLIVLIEIVCIFFTINSNFDFELCKYFKWHLIISSWNDES